MVEYNPIYAEDDFFEKKIFPSPDQSAKEHLMNIARDVETEINDALRHTLGNHDKNNFEILLPLKGDFNIIDENTMTVQLKFDDRIRSLAEEGIIAYYRRDTAESDDRLEKWKVNMKKVIGHIFGIAISSVRKDFTTDLIFAHSLATQSGARLMTQTEKPIEVRDSTAEPRIP